MVVPDSDMQMFPDKMHALRAGAVCEPVRERRLKVEHPNRLRLSALALVSRLGPHSRFPDRPLDGRKPRILIIRPDHLGDVLFTSPAVERIRAVCPQAAITYMAGPWSSDAAQRLPGVSRVWPYPFPGFSRSTGPKGLSRVLPYLRLWRLARKVRAARFDLATKSPVGD